MLPEASVKKDRTLVLDLDETLIHSCPPRDNPQVYVTAVGEYGEEAKVQVTLIFARLASMYDPIALSFFKSYLRFIQSTFSLLLLLLMLMLSLSTSILKDSTLQEH